MTQIMSLRRNNVATLSRRNNDDIITWCVRWDSKARAKHSPFAKNPDLAIIGERISGLTKILAKDFQLLGKNKQILTSHC